jgi:hypothetical protein
MDFIIEATCFSKNGCFLVTRKYIMQPADQTSHLLEYGCEVSN